MSDTAPHPTDISGTGWLATAKRVFAELSDDHVGLIAAGCAFYGLLAVFPALVAGMALAGLFVDPTGIVSQLESLTRFMPEEAAAIVIDQAKEVAGSDEGGLGLAALLGLAFALYSASAGMAALIEGIGVAFDAKDERGLVKSYLLRIGLTVATILAAIGMILLLIALPVMLDILALGYWTETLAAILRWPLILILLIVGLAVLYRYAPDRAARRWRWITPGAVVACVLWLAGSIGFAWYVQNFGTYNETFGALGGVIVLLMWLWLSSYIVLLGAEIDAEMEAQAKQAPDPANADPDTADADRLPA